MENELCMSGTLAAIGLALFIGGAAVALWAVVSFVKAMFDCTCSDDEEINELLSDDKDNVE